MDMNSQAIRNVQFREKVRGYHPADVDAFVAAVAETVERLEREVNEATSRLVEVESRSAATSEAEDSLRRTLVLAQRTADAAVQEAREEANRVMADAEEQRSSVLADLAELRERLRHDAEQEEVAIRQHLLEQRAALQADVEALGGHLERERGRLRIYFEDQLRRLEGGEPGVTPAPAMQAEPAAPPSSPAPDAVAAVDAAGDPDEEPAGAAAGEHLAPDAEDGSQTEPQTPTRPGPDAAEAATDDRSDGAVSSSAEDDPFLAELRRAVTDDEPLGPRDHEPNASSDEGDERDFDMFVKGDDPSGRFGSRFRRQR